MDLERLLRETKNHNLKQIDLSNMNLSEIPRKVFQLKQIETLKAMHNKITELPKEIIGMEKLRELYLYDNKISSIPKHILLEMPHLRCLDLAENPIDNNAVADFHYTFNKKKEYQMFLSILERQLSLNRTYFRYVGDLKLFPTEIFDFIELDHLTLNGIKSIKIPKGFGKLENLRYLDLSNNNIKKIPKDIFQLPNLEHLILSSNVIKHLPDKILNLPKIQKIYICNNKLTAFNRNIYNHPTIIDFVALDNSFTAPDQVIYNYDASAFAKRGVFPLYCCPKD